MENYNNQSKQLIYKSTLCWVSIILSAIAIIFLLLNLISGIVYSNMVTKIDNTDGLPVDFEKYHVSGLIIFTMIIAIIFFTGFIFSAAGLLKNKDWADKFFTLYLWFFIAMAPIFYLLYWAGKKSELAKMKTINNPDLTQLYEANNLAFNIHLIFLGVIALFTIIILVMVNLKIKR